MGCRELRLEPPCEGFKVYLKQVELENFKSFGGKLTVPLMEGYTAVTGPNGSGKSNISDAIMFVLGPKSSKAVRAGKLTDLIFDGGKSKNKASYMKVSLVFDNKDRLMPWDDDTVRLTRHVKLSDNGTDYTSYFYINDRKSTMGEFDSLLTKARISADGYNLVQQGDVTRIVQMGNIERRRILDGISGIASFDADIDKAKAERTEAQTNLTQTTIITDELSDQLEKLDKDRVVAQRYLDAKGKLDMANAQMVHRKLEISRYNVESITGNIEKMQQTIKESTVQHAEKQKLREENAVAIASKEAEIASKVGPEYTELKDKINYTKVEIATKNSKIESAEEDKEVRNQQKEDLEERIRDNNNQVIILRENIKDFDIKLNAAKAKEAEKVKEEGTISEEIASSGGEYRELQDRLADVEENIAACSAEFRDHQGSLAKSEAAYTEANNSYNATQTRIENIDFEIKDAVWSLEQLKKESGPSTEDFGKKIMDAKAREADLEKKEAELEKAYRDIDAEYNRLSAEKKASEKYNRNSAAVDAILSLRNRGEMAGIHGTVQELATVDKGFEVALSVAAGGKMQAVVVDDDQVAADAINYLKKEKLGRVTFLPLTKMMGGKPRAKAIMSLNQTLGYASDHIDFDPKYANVFWYVLGDTLVTKDLNIARQIMGGIRIVTVSGELIEISGAMVGGNIVQQNLPKFGVANEDKLAAVGEKLKGATEALASIRTKLREVRDEIRTIDDEMRSVTTSGAEIRDRIAQLNGAKAELEKSKKSMTDELAKAAARVSECEEMLNQSKERFSQVSENLAKLNEERDELKERMDAIAPVELQTKIQAVRDELHSLRTMITNVEGEKKVAENEIIGYGKQNETYQMQLDSTNASIHDDDSTIENNSKDLERLRVDLTALRGIEAEMESGIEDLRNEKDELLRRGYELDSEIRELRKNVESSEGVIQSNQAQLLAAQEEVQRLTDEVAQLTIEVDKPVPSEEEIRRRIRSLEKEIEALGTVNMRAIEDYDEKKQRYDSLMAQVNKLNVRIGELDTLMEQLSSKKKGLFMQSYDAVDANFRAIYAQLSGGGEAFMGLENPEDPFAGGLTINAKPRNGKLLRLESLSGGEKSLTALSFIFAIQEYQPSPFYVLDEVDMFLDSVNAEMVAKRVRESSAKAQFIQVSLRAVALKCADNLIGVTRPPTGISRIIIQPDLAEVSKYEEQAMKKVEEQQSE